ncbi:osmoprotectant transport system substrate-binding protein [Blastococcus aurantiacus]|uniref:Osmoprotectant transport system substrate-binding protein n=1 Tax=Blastococcus aurantiacus TaxID=1550231 RepID=A0A1G7RLH2_9ACTN|nr:ABC transporter substrate-binding protein [Blastococcus aurantiacus]SDG11656.1 osmoprotectant transport system substrate-binding protein [Blastococcus aurantiacus]
MGARGALLVVLLLLLPACGGQADPAPAPADAVRFASYDFPENQILVEVYAEAARRQGVPVTVQHGIGTREVVSPALQQGVVDVVVDYLGTALAFARPGFPRPPVAPDNMHAVLARTMGGRGVDVLTPSAAEDQNGFVVTRDFAAEHGVGTLSGLVPLAPDLVFGGPPECPHRPFCLLGLEKVYDMRFGEVLAMPTRAATLEALLSGQVDVGMLETTDARLAVAPVVLLADDRALQPRENVVPLVRAEVSDRWGERLRRALDETSARLTTEDLVQLNRAVELDGRSPAGAAANWWDARD